VAEIGRERGDGLLDVHAVAIPGEQPTNCKCVLQVVNPRQWKVAVASPPELQGDSTEGLADRTVG
jgi:hypothetical protein